MGSNKFMVPLTTAVITSTYIIDDKMAVLYVSHELDEDGESSWQFHSGNDDYDMAKMKLVSLGNILQLDDSLIELSDLPAGYGARRSALGEKWNSYKE